MEIVFNSTITLTHGPLDLLIFSECKADLFILVNRGINIYAGPNVLTLPIISSICDYLAVAVLVGDVSLFVSREGLPHFAFFYYLLIPIASSDSLQPEIWFFYRERGASFLE